LSRNLRSAQPAAMSSQLSNRTAGDGNWILVTLCRNPRSALKIPSLIADGLLFRFVLDEGKHGVGLEPFSTLEKRELDDKCAFNDLASESPN
jgi:hypothetical protein